jgi:hypothetical protein
MFSNDKKGKMKVILIVVILILLSFGNLFGQSEDFNNSKYQFAKEVFSKEYSKQNFEKFKGKITVESENSIRFDEKTLIIPCLAEDYKRIFTSGIFYPNIITGNQIAVTKTKKEIENMTTSEKILYNLTRIDSIQIGNLEELERLNPNSKTKRFVFWLYNKGRMNPQECYFELENKTATKETSFSQFINNANVTFFYLGTLIL